MNNKDQIIKLVDETLLNINSKIPNTITKDQKNIIIEHYSNSNRPIEDIEKELNNYSNELLNKLGYKEKPSTGKYDFNQINNTITKLYEVNKYGNMPIYIDSEITPMLLGRQIDARPKGRMFPELEVLVDLKDMEDFRSKYQKTPYFKEEDDSLNKVKDGNDYGLQLDIDGVKVHVYPFIKDKDSIETFKFKDNKYIVEEIKDNNNYLKTYEVDGNKLHSVSLEYLKRRADNKKDTELSKIIDEYGYSYDAYNSITPTKKLKEVEASSINNVSTNEIVKNSLVKFIYEVKMKDNKDVSQEKLDETIKRLHNKPFEEITKYLAKAKDNLNKKIEVPKSLYDKQIEEKNKTLTLNKGYSTTQNMAYTIIIAGIVIIILSILLKLM